ncbi:unnamed protein product [Sphenostylis stenocarpa]|uniref:Uncharacterized protein n=1 Tax=Sphenostylis stenocarpa TaxID=92480 RepID=A0AA86S547_9FABA|nr:unnamed protein product [Sphenostylis stenocarpa]
MCQEELQTSVSKPELEGTWVGIASHSLDGWIGWPVVNPIVWLSKKIELIEMLLDTTKGDMLHYILARHEHTHEYHGSLSRCCKIQARDSFLPYWDLVLEQNRTKIMRLDVIDDVDD